MMLFFWYLDFINRHVSLPTRILFAVTAIRLYSALIPNGVGQLYRGTPESTVNALKDIEELKMKDTTPANIDMMATTSGKAIKVMMVTLMES